MDVKIQLSDEHASALQKFKELFKNVPSLSRKNDYFFLRWLIARNFDLVKAEKMLSDSLAWRAENQIDDIFEHSHSNEAIIKYMPVGLISRNKMGHPIGLARIGLMDLKGLSQSLEPDEDVKFYVRTLESFWNSQNKDEGNDQEFIQITGIADMKGLGIQHLTVPAAVESTIKICKVYEANYPEVLRKLFIINAPKIFDIAFSLIKPLLSEKTLSKISFFGHNSDIWKAALLAEIPAEILPVSYGGTMTDPLDGNPDCSSLVNMGGIVPTHYYLKNRETKLIESNETGTLLVESRSKKNLEIRVKNTNTIINWEFYSKEGDLVFGITRKAGKDVEVLVPFKRVDCHISKESGKSYCTKPGLYVMEFDNSFSYLRSKTVLFSIKISEDE